MADSWRDYILNEFAPQAAQLTLVADPDGLLAEEGIVQALRERGFELLTFEDHVAFRFIFETQYRPRWQAGETVDLIIVLPAPQAALATLPYDLVQLGRPLAFSLADLFPNLSAPIVGLLDRSDFDLLYQAQNLYMPGVLGENPTQDFILRHVFSLDPLLIHTETDLLRALLRQHHGNHPLPKPLAGRVAHLLQQTSRFSEWPLETLIADREAFFAFLQERWPVYLDQLTTPTELRERALPLQYPGPAHLPFEHHDVRVYVDTLFLEGHLRPVSHPAAPQFATQWMAVGVRQNPQADREHRLTDLMTHLTTDLPTPEARHQDWLTFAPRWAELLALKYAAASADAPELEARFVVLQQTVEQLFLDWVQRRYSGLSNLPPRPPVMVHHLARAMAAELSAARATKLALVVLDGLSLDQWVTVRAVLQTQLPDAHLRESAVFAWVPTLTSVSRQAIFAGCSPVFFPDSLLTTDKEPALWAQFWAEPLASAGITIPSAVAHIKTLREAADLPRLDEFLSHPQLRIAGLVVDQVDKIMHGMELGSPGMHQQVRQWLGQGFLAQTLTRLREHGFQIWLTSDHGNITARGLGNPGEQALADVRGQRVRIYPNVALRAEVQRRFPTTIAWPLTALPNDFVPLLAADREAFITAGEQTVSHGSISVEELIVPVVRVEWRPK